MRRWITIASGTLLLTLVIAFWQQSRLPKPIALIPSLSGETEYCLTCHQDLPEISPSHPVEAFGCVLCHGGERLALDAGLAHSSMRGGKNPSDLSVVEASCGGDACHSGAADDERDHIHRVLTGVQATYSGALANIRYTFGAQPDLTPRVGIRAVQDDLHDTLTGIVSLSAFDSAGDDNPSIQKFSENCLDCHLYAAPRDEPDYARYTGCSACHTLTAPGPESGGGAGETVHNLTTAIPYTQCNTCHNRGNYDLRKMEFIERSDQPTDRLHAYYQPIAQFTRCEWTLDCVDCHTRGEAMGDGDIHPDQAHLQNVQCKSCHGTLDELPLKRTLSDADDVAFRLAALNPVLDLQLGDTILVTEAGEPLWNTRVLPDGTYELFGKANNQRFTFKPVQGSACQQDPEQQESRYCHECHTYEVTR